MATRKQLVKKKERRDRRHFRLRKKVKGSAGRPRMVVYRSLRNIEVQLVDDTAGHSLLGLSTLSKELRATQFENRVEQGKEVGKRVAAKAQEAGIGKVVFDRSGFLYHGIVRAVAEGAREGGLEF